MTSESTTTLGSAPASEGVSAESAADEDGELVVSVELDPETDARIEAQWKRLRAAGNPPLSWSRFCTVLLWVGLDEMERLASEDHLNILDTLGLADSGPKG